MAALSGRVVHGETTLLVATGAAGTAGPATGAPGGLGPIVVHGAGGPGVAAGPVPVLVNFAATICDSANESPSASLE